MTALVAVLISGRGSNLQAILDRTTSGELPIEIRVVISNRPGAEGLLHAERAGIPTEVIDHKAFDSRDDFDAALKKSIDQSGAELLLLAGFMRILTPPFIEHYEGRILNIHPSLLPKFQGLNTHERAIQAGEKMHGASVHFVSNELDGGPTILQAQIPVRSNDDKNSLAARVLEVEHRIYPIAIRWYTENRIRYTRQGAILDGALMTAPAQLTDLEEG